MKAKFLRVLPAWAFLWFAACGAPAQPAAPTATAAPAASSPPSPIPQPSQTSTPQPFAAPQSFSPEDLPKGYNPLTGQLAKDPSTFKIPALLVSVSHFPPDARPQAGLSFAPWVFEFSITEGMTRFLAVFYGGFPEAEVPLTGGCEIRQGVFVPTGEFFGGRVWLDENQNGRREPYERGVGGVCARLYQDGRLVDSTTTDSNGYYGFNAAPANQSVEIVLPAWLSFTAPNVGDETYDSDANPLDGRMEARAARLDAGLIARAELSPTPNAASLPKPEVGPVRSGRLLYADIAAFFPSSCLIYAYASPEVLAEIPKCAMVAHEETGGGAMLPLDRMKAIADDNMRGRRGSFNYASAAFSETPPPGGAPAEELRVYVARVNQSAWRYDPLYGAWLRFVDEGKVETAGVLHPDVERLTGRQLYFENVVVILAEHDVISPTNLDIHLEHGSEGYAFLFRDGKKYDIRWNTKSTEYEKRSGTLQPIRFTNPDGSLFPLKPGRTWIFLASIFSKLTEESSGAWLLRFIPPAGSK